MTHYLTRAVLNRQAPEHTLRPLLNPVNWDMAFDAHHRLMWTLFPDRGSKRDFLWRAEDKGKFLILSSREPQGSRLFKPLESKSFAPVLAAGDLLAFILRANATRDRRSGPHDDVAPGTRRRPLGDRRVDMVMHAMREQGIKGQDDGCRFPRCQAHGLGRRSGGGVALRPGRASGFCGSGVGGRGLSSLQVEAPGWQGGNLRRARSQGSADRPRSGLVRQCVVRGSWARPRPLVVA